MSVHPQGGGRLGSSAKGARPKVAVGRRTEAFDVSVLVVHYGPLDLTLRALSSLRQATRGRRVEVLVRDNTGREILDSGCCLGSWSGLPTRLHVGEGWWTAAAQEVDLRGSANLGFGPANNLLAADARGHFLLFLNNDAVLAPGALDVLLEAAADGARAGGMSTGRDAWTPQFRFFDGRALELGSHLGPDASGWQLMRGRKVPPGLRDVVLTPHYGSAACLLMQSSLFAELGGFDERFAPAYYEDTDLALRLRQRGGRVLCVPRAVCFHLEGGGSQDQLRSTSQEHLARSRSLFYGRWHREIAGHAENSQAVALRQALAGDAGDAGGVGSGAVGPGEDPSVDRWTSGSSSSRGAPLVLWLLHEFLDARQSGGHARIRKEIEALLRGGVRVVLWSEHLAGADALGPELGRLGVPWFGYHRPGRWPFGGAEAASASRDDLRSVEDLLRLQIWDGVVASSADLAGRFEGVVRDLAPEVPWIVDNMVLAYLQSDRARGRSVRMPREMVVDKAWELGVYERARAVIASSDAEAALIRRELGDAEVFSYDVGAYEPRPVDRTREGVVFLGSFLHPPNLDAVLWWIEEIAPAVAERMGQPISLRVVGAASRTVLAEWSESPWLDVRGWVEDLDEELGGARVFLSPLRYGAGTKDKIALAMRYGTPVVTTSIGAESMPVHLASALQVADTAPEIATLVVDLLRNERLHRRAVRRTRQAAIAAWRAQDGRSEVFARWFRRLLGEGKRCVDGAGRRGAER